MLPDTGLICGMGSGASLCNAGVWHAVFVIQTLIVLSLGLTNAIVGLRHRLGILDTPLDVARMLARGTMLAGAVPLVTGMWLKEKVRRASYACYLEHDETGCTHDLIDRFEEMQQVGVWVGWVEATLFGTCLLGLWLLSKPLRRS